MAEQFGATITPTATGGADALNVATSHMTKAQTWNNAFGAAQQVTQAAVAVTEEERKRQSMEDMANASVFASEEKVRISQMPAGDQATAWQTHIDSIQNGESEQSDTYNRTLLNSILPSYTSAATEHNRQLTENSIRMSTDTSVLDSINIGDFSGAATTISDTAKREKVDVARVRDSYYGSFYNYYSDKIQGISNNEDLAMVMEEMKGAEATLNSPQLMGNKSTGESGTFLRGQKQRFASTLSSVQSAITKNNKLTIQATENKNDPNVRGRYTQHPSINKDKYPNAVAYKEAVQAYEAHSSDVSQANGYDTETSSNFNALDSGAQDIVKQDITTSLVNNFDDYDGETLANTLISQKQNANNGTSHIKTNLYSLDEATSAESFMKIQNLRKQPNGEEALNVIFTKEDERNKYDAIVAVQEAGIVGSMFEANKFMNQPTVPWKFDGRKEEGKYNDTFNELPTAIGNRGRNVYKTLRAHGVDHATALEAGEKSVEAKTDVGGIDIYGTNNLIQGGAKVQRTVGTHLKLMTEPFGTEVVHNYDMWSDTVVSTNEYGIIVNTTSKSELLELATTKEAFERDAKEHKYAEAWEGAMDSFNTTLQTKVLRTPAERLVGGPTHWNTPDKLMNAFMNTYTFGKGVRKDGNEFTGR